MLRKFRLSSCFLLLLTAFIMGVTQARAAISVVDYWRMGENDSGAVAGQPATSTTDSVGGPTMTFANAPNYSAQVSLPAAAHTGSDLCLQISTGQYGSTSAISLTDNFGLECWVNPASTAPGGQILVLDGIRSTGWGLYQDGTNFEGIFGGVAFFGSAPATAGTWTHLALVCSSGTTTFYVNGLSAGTTTETPISPSGTFTLGGDVEYGEYYSGLIDEVRVFTFTAGQFSTNDLLINQSALSTAYLGEGPAAGTDGVTLTVTPTGSAWTATANASWLHLVQSSGNGKTNVLFTFDANTGITRTGTLTIAGRTLTVTQASSTYVPAGVTTLVSSGLSSPYGVAVDGVGNVYISDTENSQVKEWVAANNTVTTLVPSGLSRPEGLAVDGVGNVYIADTFDSQVKEWVAASNTVTTLIFANYDPAFVAVDSSGNVYITGDSRVKEWVAASQTVTNLVFSTNLPFGVAVDIAGNVYFSLVYTPQVAEWVAASKSVTTIESGLEANGVAVDSAGNVYFANGANSAIAEWVAASNTVSALVPSGLSYPEGVAVDGAGNVYFADSFHSQIKELPRAFVVSMPRYENAPAGNDILPPVVPATASLTGPFAPASDSSWLTITGITNGVVSYAFTANTSNTNRTAHVTLLGHSIPVTQWPPFILGATNLVEGPAAFADSVVLATGATNAWTATANDSWLHLAGAYQSGVGSTNVLFSFDTNSGLTRTGSITIGNQTLTVVQAGSGYVAAGLLTVLPGISQPQADQPAVAVDGAGNVYASDEDNGSIDEWIPGNDTASSHFAGEVDPLSVAADQAGNLYIADFNNFLEKASLTSDSITTLSGYVMNGSTGYGMAVDGMGNLYIADTTSNVVSQWSLNNQSVGILISSGLNQPSGVAVDAAGNLYIADTGSKSIKKWTASTGLLSSFVTGLNNPFAVAVDGSGNVCIADSGAGVIYKWTAAYSSLAVLINGLGDPTGVAVDALGNVYLAAYNASDPVKELPRAFVNTSTRYESAGAGTDSLPPVLPYTESLSSPFNPNIEQSPDWITASSTNNGAISFSFGDNSANSSVRTAQYYLFGQPTEIIQQWVIAPYLLGPVLATNGGVQISFTNNQAGATFTVLSTTDLSLPLDAWTVAGMATNIGSGVYQFTSEPLANTPQIFYSVSSP